MYNYPVWLFWIHLCSVTTYIMADIDDEKVWTNEELFAGAYPGMAQLEGCGSYKRTVPDRWTQAVYSIRRLRVVLRQEHERWVIRKWSKTLGLICDWQGYICRLEDALVDNDVRRFIVYFGTGKDKTLKTLRRCFYRGTDETKKRETHAVKLFKQVFNALKSIQTADIPPGPNDTVPVTLAR